MVDWCSKLGYNNDCGQETKTCATQINMADVIGKFVARPNYHECSNLSTYYSKLEVKKWVSRKTSQDFRWNEVNRITAWPKKST
nr:MAG TPA: hypothetical protein [Caudoviricetes sp.]